MFCPLTHLLLGYKPHWPLLYSDLSPIPLPCAKSHHRGRGPHAYPDGPLNKACLTLFDKCHEYFLTQGQESRPANLSASCAPGPTEAMPPRPPFFTSGLASAPASLPPPHHSMSKSRAGAAGQQQTQFPLPMYMCWVSRADPLPCVPSSQHTSGQRLSGQHPPHTHPYFQDFLLPGRKREKDFPVPPPNLTRKGILLLGTLNCWGLPGPSAPDRRGSWGCM